MCKPFLILNIYPPTSEPINAQIEELDSGDRPKTYLEKDIDSIPVRGRRNIAK
jgi:hypothetical protein